MEKPIIKKYESNPLDKEIIDTYHNAMVEFLKKENEMIKNLPEDKVIVGRKFEHEWNEKTCSVELKVIYEIKDLTEVIMNKIVGE
jgi:hypothetical protein